MIEIKYTGAEKCFKHNVTIFEKLVQMNAMRDLIRTIYMHGLSTTLKESTKTQQPELYNFVQASSSNNVNILDDELKKKFQKVMENLNFGWDSGQMSEVKSHLKSWIGKENGASRSALSIIHLS